MQHIHMVLDSESQRGILCSIIAQEAIYLPIHNDQMLKREIANEYLYVWF